MDLPQPGQVIAGKYRVEGVIGSGGMGVVLGAVDTSLGRPVAIKFLSPHKARREGAVARFLREARAAAAIQSEHVVRVFEIGTAPNGAPYIVMEQLRGNDLAQQLQRTGPLPIPLAVDHLLQACEALGEAHARGIVHRDLKPQNLFVTARPDGSPCVKILDFGISKAIEEGAPNLTSTDQVMGTPLYMSPEQVRSLKNVDHRSDIWALGSILFELVTGRPIFEAPSASALCAMIAMDPPIPLRARLPQAPAELEAVILRSLHKDPAGRFQDVAQLAEALAPFATERGRASATRVSRVVRSTGGSAGGAGVAMTPGATGIPHLGAPGAPGSNPTVDALGRPSYAPQQLLGAAPPAWAPQGGSVAPPYGSMPPANAGSALPAPMMGGSTGLPNAPPPTQSTWQHTHTGNLTQTGERRGMSAAVVALLGVLTGVVLLAVLVVGAYILFGQRGPEASAATDAGGVAAKNTVVDSGALAAVAGAGATATTTSTPTTGPKPGVVVPVAKKDAGASTPVAPVTKDAGAPKPAGPTPAEELEARRRSAQSKCDHLSFLLGLDKAPGHDQAKNIKLQTCWNEPDKPSCERTLCLRACTILDDKMCIDSMERHNRQFPPPF